MHMDTQTDDLTACRAVAGDRAHLRWRSTPRQPRERGLMIPFDDLGRWRPDALLWAADRLEDGETVHHFGHLHDVTAVIDALRHAATQIRAARVRAIETAETVTAQGWGFQIVGDDVVVQEKTTSVVTYGAELDRVEDLMAEYAGTIAGALTEIGVALDDLQAVIGASRQDPSARAHRRPRRPLRTTFPGPACRDHRRDPWPGCWER